MEVLRTCTPDQELWNFFHFKLLSLYKKYTKRVPVSFCETTGGNKAVFFGHQLASSDGLGRNEDISGSAGKETLHLEKNNFISRHAFRGKKHTHTHNGERCGFSQVADFLPTLVQKFPAGARHIAAAAAVTHTNTWFIFTCGFTAAAGECLLQSGKVTL